MHRITPIENHSMFEILRAQAMAIEKYGMYAHMCRDPQLRGLLQDAQSRHVRRYHALLRKVQEQQRLAQGHAQPVAQAGVQAGTQAGAAPGYGYATPTAGDYGGYGGYGGYGQAGGRQAASPPRYGQQMYGGYGGHGQADAGRTADRPGTTGQPSPVTATPAALTASATPQSEEDDLDEGVTNATYGSLTGAHEVLDMETAEEPGASGRTRRGRGTGDRERSR